MSVPKHPSDAPHVGMIETRRGHRSSAIYRHPSRRDWIMRTGSGLAGVALAQLLADDGAANKAFANETSLGTSLDKPPHHPPRVRSVIWLFMEGGPSHIDLFDPKPLLNELDGKPIPDSFELPVTSATGSHRMPLIRSPRKWKRHGESGLWVSEWYSQIAKQADELAVIRSCWANGLNHVGSVRQMNTGSVLAGRPSLGAWVSYGLGAANQNLPTFVCMTDDKIVRGGTTNWSSGFLPASYQGTLLQQEGPAILDLSPANPVSLDRQRSRLDYFQLLNAYHRDKRPGDALLDARLETYELAYRMQSAAPESVDLSKETQSTRALYGLDETETATFGRNCLMARRLVERGVRFVELYCGSGSGWDGHSGLEANHTKWCRASDRPIAGLLQDLKARGLLDQTLVVWGGEFGRTPFSDTGAPGGKNYGRDHNPWGFSMWMAGGGIRGGQTIGATDEIGFRATENRCHVHDIHATILHLLGLNHLELTYLHNGRDERATINGGELIPELIAT